MWIVHLDELAPAPKNYPLLPLARGEKLRQFIDLCIENELDTYLQFVLDIGNTTDPSAVIAKIMEMLQMKLRHKFADLPAGVTTHVQQTTDLAQLEAWTIQLLTAQSWQEIFGAMSEAGDGATDTR